VLQLLLLENVRFYKEEEKNVAEFAQKVRLPLAVSAVALASTAQHMLRLWLLGKTELACIDGMKMTLVQKLLHAASIFVVCCVGNSDATPCKTLCWFVAIASVNSTAVVMLQLCLQLSANAGIPTWTTHS
jgi:hypothetical protein